MDEYLTNYDLTDIEFDHDNFLLETGLDIDVDNNGINQKNVLEYYRNLSCHSRNDNIFFSPFLFNKGVDKQAHTDTVTVEQVLRNKGYGFFTTGKIYYDSNSDKWSCKSNEENIYARINIIDKLKVSSANILAENSEYELINSEASIKEIKSNKNTFLHEVGSVVYPMGTWLRYKTVSTTQLPLSDAGFIYEGNRLRRFNDLELNTININLTRGIYELINFVRIVIRYHHRNNTNNRMVVIIPQIKLFNTSITIDSIISSVTNEASFTASSLWNKNKQCFKDNLVLLPKKSGKKPFPTNIIVEPLTESSIATTHPITRRRPHNDKGINAVELQVHPRNLNSSAIDGVRALHVVKNCLIRLLNSVKIDLFLSNCKALCELLSRSLISAIMNDFCELLAWKLETRHKSKTEQMEMFFYFKEKVFDKLWLSRNNYSQYGPFSIHPCSSRLLDKYDCELVSHKYKNIDTNNIFNANINTIQRIVDLHPKGRQLYVGIFTRKNNKKQANLNFVNSRSISIKKKIQLYRKRGRTKGIVGRYLYDTVYFNENFPFEPPMLSDY